MKKYTVSEDEFLGAVSGHKMTVIHDDGVYRHLRFRRKESSVYWFDLITWPGTLCIDGDMGTFVFRRLEDMFEFFRTDREYLTRSGNQLVINPSYWSEKLQAPKSRAVEEFSAEAFREHVKEAFDAYVIGVEPDVQQQLWDELESEVICIADDGEIRAYDAARDFFSFVAEDFNMNDCWEWSCREYTCDFIWCCYAIAWGIKTYDDVKETNE